MKKTIVSLLIAGTMALSLSACGGSSSSDDSKSDIKTETTTDKTEESTDTATDTDTSNKDADATPVISIDIDKCISDLKDNLQLDPDYTFVRDYYIGAKDNTITITAVVDDATDPSLALDFADTLVRQLNLYAQMQDSSIESASKDFYGGLYTQYDALVGVSPASQTKNEKEWFVHDAISGGKTMLNLNKQYR